MTLIVHHLENSRSQRVLWLLEELQLPYDVKRYERNKKTLLAPPELRKIHPLGKSPVIEDTDTTGTRHVIAETGAIIDYLVAKTGKLGPSLSSAPSTANSLSNPIEPPTPINPLTPSNPPTSSESRHPGATSNSHTPSRSTASPPSTDPIRYRHFLHYAEGSLMPVLFTQLVLSRVPLLGRIALKKFQPMIDVHVDYVEAELTHRPWFAGDSFTAADVMMSYPLEVARTRGGISPESHPHIFTWVDTIHARPAYQAALSRGGPYAFI